MQKHLLAALALVASLIAPAARAEMQTVTIGTLQLTTAGALVLAEANGDLAREGLQVNHFWGQAAQDVVMATAAGAVDIATASFTASFYNLAGKGAFKIIWGQTREVPHFHNNGYVASNAAWDAGLRSLKDLPGHRIGITTTGGGLHYSLGLLSRKFGWPMSAITMVPLQSFPNLVAAFRGGQLEVMAAASGVIAQLPPGSGHVLGWSGDETPWQLGAVFLRPQFIAQHRPTVEAFLRAYKNGCARYNHALNAVDANGDPAPGPGYEEALAQMATGLGMRRDDVVRSLGYMPEDCALDVADIRNQVNFWQSENLIDKSIKADDLLDLSFGAGK